MFFTFTYGISAGCLSQELTGLQCGHNFCSECWESYLTTKVMDEGKGQTIACANHGCEILVDDAAAMWVNAEKNQSNLAMCGTILFGTAQTTSSRVSHMGMRGRWDGGGGGFSVPHRFDCMRNTYTMNECNYFPSSRRLISDARVKRRYQHLITNSFVEVSLPALYRPHELKTLAMARQIGSSLREHRED